MRAAPKHFHMAAAVLLLLAAAAMVLKGQRLGAAFLALGAGIALVHWNAAKAGLIH
jgi:hypothetical protein